MSELDTERGYYMVRAKSQSDEEFACFFENDVVAIGWSRVDIRDLSSKSEVDEAMSEHRYDPNTGVDLSNQIVVSYVRDANGDFTVSRSDLTEALQRRLRVRGSTVTDLGEFAEEIEPETWGDHDLVLVTTGRVPEEVQDKAEQVDVEVLGGRDLIDWLLDHVDVLSPKSRRSLGISEVPFLMS